MLLHVLLGLPGSREHPAGPSGQSPARSPSQHERLPYRANPVLHFLHCHCATYAIDRQTPGTRKVDSLSGHRVELGHALPSFLEDQGVIPSLPRSTRILRRRLRTRRHSLSWLFLYIEGAPATSELVLGCLRDHRDRLSTPSNWDPAASRPSGH